MCGICGVLNFNGEKAEESLLRQMSSALVHRGPDALGYYVQGNVGFGHRRLSIIDLATGNQPLHNEEKTAWLIMNGEIYNFRQLRTELEKKGHIFRTKTDAEVIVHLYEEHGVECLQYLRGMFAFAIWDEEEKQLFIARDRLGKKPLVYWQDKDRFIFASELRALLEAPYIEREVDNQALNLYLSFLYIPAPWTMFKKVKKLPPAHYLLIRNNDLRMKRYWNLQFGFKQRRKGVDDYKQGLIEQLDEAVRMRLVSDVPLGVFLSGGIDSSAIVALMSRHCRNPVKTFSVGFSNALYNELRFARILSRDLKTEHHELMVRPNAIEILPEIVRHYGEPFADCSCIPTYYLAQFAAQTVKVALTGDGGDESFAGYYRYTAAQAAELFDIFPRFLILGMYSLVKWLPNSDDVRTLSWQIKRFFKSLHLPPQQRYLDWIATFTHSDKAELYDNGFADAVDLNHDLEFRAALYRQNQGIGFAESAMKVDIQTYLPYDLLVKMDIATMAHSLEARSPFLDHRFMEYAAMIPFDLKLHHFTSKYILKKALSELLPPAIMHRGKQGFAIPIGEWVRGQLHDYVRDILLDAVTAGRGYFKRQYIRSLLKEHMEHKTDNGYKIWTLLMLELWHREFLD